MSNVLHTHTHTQINLIAPPQYVITTTTLDRTEGIAKLNTAIQVIRETIEESEGQFNVKMEVSADGRGIKLVAMKYTFSIFLPSLLPPPYPSLLPTPPSSLQPKVVTDIEDEELRKQMEELQLANQEVAGDDDTSDQEDIVDVEDK